jgi:MtN3 and saliva related transmembrane protein
MEIFKTIIGYLATIVGTSIMLPQIYKSIKTKSVSDVSWGMLVLYFLNCLLWLIYGILILASPLMITNGIALAISILQIVLKIKYKKS